MTGYTFHVNHDRASLQAVIRSAQAILDTLPADSEETALAAAARAQADVAAKAARLRSHLSKDMQDFLLFLADNYADKRFIWDDVAKDMGRKLETVKSWHRIISRPLSRINAELGEEPKLLQGNWDGHRNHYRLNDEWREAILTWR